jgi:outer membrane protein assembly factor BamB
MLSQEDFVPDFQVLRMIVVASVAAVCSGGMLGKPLPAEDWPHWFGPTHDAVWHEEGIIESFPAEGPKVLWRAPVNKGYSGPSVAAGKVFLSDRIAGDVQNRKQGQGLPGVERYLCFDASTGKPLWTREYNVDYRISYPEGPRTTPTVDGDRVYYLGAMGHLACLKVETGETIWEMQLTEKYQTRPPVWGFSVHPRVDGDRLICVVGGEGSAVVCLNKMTGEEIWKSQTAEEVGYAPPVIVEKDGVRQLIYWHDTGLVGLNPETGEALWTHEFPKVPPQRPVVCIVTPRVHDDLLLVSDFYNGSLLLKLDFKKPGVREVWSSTPGDQEHRNDLNVLMGTVVIHKDHIYGIAGEGEMRCVSLLDQSLVWRNLAPSSAKRDALFATSFFVRNGNRFFQLNDQGFLKICKLSPKGFEEISSASILKPTSFARGRDVVWSHPAFASRCMFARNDEELICFDLAATPG